MTTTYTLISDAKLDGYGEVIFGLERSGEKDIRGCIKRSAMQDVAEKLGMPEDDPLAVFSAFQKEFILTAIEIAPNGGAALITCADLKERGLIPKP